MGVNVVCKIFEVPKATLILLSQSGNFVKMLSLRPSSTLGYTFNREAMPEHAFVTEVYDPGKSNGVSTS